MAIKFYSLILVGFLFGTVSCVVSREEIAAQAYIDLVQAEYIRQYDTMRGILWDQDDVLTVDELMDKLDFLSQSQNFSVNVARTLSVYNIDNFENVDLKRQIKLLKDIRTLHLDFPSFVTLSNSLQVMKNFTTEKIVCSYENPRLCNMGLLPEIKERFKNSQDPNELEYYWKAWRDEMGVRMLENLRTYIELYKESSMQNRYTKPSHQWYSKFENPHLINEMTDIMVRLKPIYVELHSYIRRILRETYGDHIVEQHGAIPQHLLDQTLVQAWSYRSILKDPYPDKKLPNIKQHLKEQEFTSLKMVEMADDFFNSLGFDPMQRAFWSDYVKMIPDSQAGPDCKSEVFDFYRIVGLKYCPKPNFKKFIQVHGDMASVHYINEKSPLPFGLRDEACPGFGKALGEAAVLACSTPNHIQGTRILEREYNYDDERSLNRIFRLGVHTLLQIPFYYIHERIWTDLLDGWVTLDNANCKYWEYMLEYMGVDPPSDRTNINLDFGYRFYEHLDERKPHSAKFVSEILGYQFYKGLCEISGQYRKNDPNLVLQNCDFFGSVEAGDALKEIMRSGAKRPWYDIITPVTGTRKLDAEALLEFYEPLYQWLRENNIRHRTPVGWHKKHQCTHR